MIKLKYPNYQGIGQHAALSRMKSFLILKHLIQTTRTDYFIMKVKYPKNFGNNLRTYVKTVFGVSPLKLDDKILVNGVEKANAPNNQFYSVFTNEDLTNLPQAAVHSHISVPNISFSTEGITNLLKDLDANKSPGPDGIPAAVLKACVSEIAPILQVIFTQSLTIQTVYLMTGSQPV